MDWRSIGIGLLIIGGIAFTAYGVWAMYRARFSKRTFFYTLMTLFLMGGTLGSLSMLYWELSYFCWLSTFVVFMILLAGSKFLLWRRKRMIVKAGKEHV